MCDFCKFNKGLEEPATSMLTESEIDYGVLGKGIHNLGLWVLHDKSIVLSSYVELNANTVIGAWDININYCPMCGRSLKGDDADV